MRYLALLLFVLMPMSMYSVEWELGGQLMLRSELDDRDFNSSNQVQSFTSLRSRLDVTFTNDNKDVKLFLQVQDSRLLGSEMSTLSQSSFIDIHQAFVQIDKPMGLPLSAQIGRFEMAYGTQRFIGAVGWHYVGRSFDGLRMKFDLSDGLDVFVINLDESNRYIGNPNPAAYVGIDKNMSKGSLFGFWQQIGADVHKFSVFAYHKATRSNIINTMDEPPFVPTISDQNITTLGVDAKLVFDQLSFLLDFGYQMGSMDNGISGSVVTTDVAAMLVGLFANYKTDSFGFGVGFDMVSGNDPTKEDFGAFNPEFGTNHKFYGFMDYFIGIPKNTNGAGLVDIYAVITYNASKKLTLKAAFHNLSSQQDYYMGTTKADSKAFGNEIDLTGVYKIDKKNKVVMGFSTFLSGDIMKMNYGTDDPGMWAYVMFLINM